MKKYLLLCLLLPVGASLVAQEKKVTNAQPQQWKIRFRGIAAIPPSSSYQLGTSDVTISTSVVPEIDFTYFFSRNLAAELILGTTKHTVKLKNSSSSTDLGNVWLLPPTLNLQYHFPGKSVTPYIGAGLNYSIFYGVKDAGASLAYKNKAGFSTQFGLDCMISDKWFINLDIKKIFLKTDVTLKGATPTVLSGVKVDPLVIGLGVGVKL